MQKTAGLSALNNAGIQKFSNFLFTLTDSTWIDPILIFRNGPAVLPSITILLF